MLLGTYVFCLTLGAGPDPLALLRGVENVRTPLHGTLRLTMTSEGIKPPSKEPRVVKIWIDFDRDRRRFIREEKVFVLRAPNPGEAPSPYDQYVAMGKDTARAVASGLAYFQDARIRTALDGDKAFQYLGDKGGGASIRDGTKGAVEMCFDPRILGIARNINPDRTIAESLGLATAQGVRLVGQETIRGVKVWRVAVRATMMTEVHFWIEDREGYRVHRYEARSERKDTVPWICRQDSHYQGGAIFPNRIEELNSSHSGDYRVTYDIESINLTKAPDPSLFGLKGLELPRGEPVQDDRIYRRIGYWDGEKLVDEMPRPPAKPVALPGSNVGWDWVTIALVAAALVGGGWLIIVYLRRRAEQTGT